LYERILKYIRTGQSTFKSADEYVTFVLEELLPHAAAEEAGYSPEEEDRIRERLRRLGYT
jgi:hypothetical protein